MKHTIKGLKWFRITQEFGSKVGSKVKICEWFIHILGFREVLVCWVCDSSSNRSEMDICMSNCLWSWVSWHILTSRGRSHMFLAWSQIFLLLWIILNRLSVFHVFDFKPLDVKFAIKLWSKNSWFQKRLYNCEKLSFDFIAFVIAFLNCFNFKEIKSLEAEFYLI